MRYPCIALASVLFFAIQPALAKERVAQCSALSFELKQIVSLQDLARLAERHDSTGRAGTITFETFDEEDRPGRSRARAVGLIFASLGDLGETPVGGYVWMTNAIGTTRVTSSNRRDADGTASMVLTVEGNPPACPQASSTFKLQQGGRFYVNGVLQGTIR